MSSFLCQVCQKNFEVSDTILAKYHGWQPKQCMKCKKPPAASTTRKHAVLATRREENLTPEEALAKYTEGPKDGVFTDGAADPNPGRGGWGAVYVNDDAVVAQDFGSEPYTTNNRMELCALLAGLRMVPIGVPTVVYSDSKLCVDTFNVWAKDWEERGWRKKKGEIKNLELIQRIYELLQRRPEITLKWIQAHAGLRWNEYADSLATAYRRPEQPKKTGERYDA